MRRPKCAPKPCHENAAKRCDESPKENNHNRTTPNPEFCVFATLVDGGGVAICPCVPTRARGMRVRPSCGGRVPV